MADLINLFGIAADPRLADLPDLQIQVACTKCGSGWQYDRNERIAALGNITVGAFVWRLTSTCFRKASIADPCTARLL